MQKPLLLLVDDDPAMIQIMGRILSPLADIRFATSGKDALRLARETPFELMLLDAQLGDMEGLQVLQTLQADPLLAELPVIFVTSHDEEALEVAVLQHGAVDFIAKPVRAAPLMARVQTQLKIRRLTRELRQIATQDGLTGVANRRAFDQALAREWRLAERARQPLSLLMVDVDFFKRYNDHYGHQAGDECLKQLAKLLQTLSQRPGDLAARYGGEEFVLLLSDASWQGAEHVAQRLLQAVQALHLPHATSELGYVTVSVGLACQEPEAINPDLGCETLLHRADMALYEAKKNGRARVCRA
jgi:diguanylate cyclase (GGDEF)-like protein